MRRTSCTINDGTQWCPRTNVDFVENTICIIVHIFFTIDASIRIKVLRRQHWSDKTTGAEVEDVLESIAIVVLIVSVAVAVAVAIAVIAIIAVTVVVAVAVANAAVAAAVVVQMANL